MKTVYIFGSLNMDLVITAPREVKNGETVSGSGFMTNGGGKGANQAVACGKLGARAVMGGCVGADDFGRRLTAGLEEARVDCSRVRRIAGVPTGVAMIVVTNGDNRIILDAGANGLAGRDDVDALLCDAKPGDLLLVQLENPIETVGYALICAKEKGMTTLLNPAPMNQDIRAYLPWVDILVPNEHEFLALTGTEQIPEGARELSKLGVSHVVVTLGDKGYCCCSGIRVLCEDCVKRQVVDTTAAGDTFCGALAVKLSQDAPLEEALHFANLAASFTVTRKGAQQAIPWLEELS